MNRKEKYKKYEHDKEQRIRARMEQLNRIEPNEQSEYQRRHVEYQLRNIFGKKKKRRRNENTN